MIKAERIPYKTPLPKPGQRTELLPKDPKYPELLVMEFDYIRDNYPFIVTKHRKKSTYEQSLRIIRALIKGPNKVLRLDEQAAILSAMIGVKVYGQELTEEMIRQRFLNKVFEEHERMELYEKLNNYCSKEYNRDAQRTSLGEATYNSRRIYSDLCYLCFYTPEKAARVLPVRIEPIKEYLDQAIDRIYQGRENITQRDRISLAVNISRLKEKYTSMFRPRFGRIARYHYGYWESFFNGFLEYLETNWSDSQPNFGWFNPDRKIVGRWLNELELMDKSSGYGETGRLNELSL